VHGLSITRRVYSRRLSACLVIQMSRSSGCQRPGFVPRWRKPSSGLKARPGHSACQSNGPTGSSQYGSDVPLLAPFIAPSQRVQADHGIRFTPQPADLLIDRDAEQFDGDRWFMAQPVIEHQFTSSSRNSAICRL
jgi:hypothetical protein